MTDFLIFWRSCHGTFSKKVSRLYMRKRNYYRGNDGDLPVRLPVLSGTVCEYRMQHYNSPVSRYAAWVPFLFPTFHSHALLRWRLAHENIFCLFYRLLPHTHSFPAGSKIFYSPHSDLFYAVSVCCHTDPVHRSGWPSKSGSRCTG